MKRKIITGIIIVAIVCIALCLIIAIKSRNITDFSEDSVRKINVNEVTRSVFYAPQYVAIKNGYFLDEKIEIDLVTGQGADAVMTAVLAGQSDIGFAGPEASIYVYNEGKEDYTEVFAQLTKRDGSFLISREKNDNFKFEDLKGKVIIPGRKGGVPYMTLEYVLKQNGINPQKDLTLDDSISFDLMAGAFSGGTADYVTLFEPTASQVQNLGKGYIVASIGKESGEIPYTAYFAKKSYIEANKDMIQGFTNAIYRGQKWVESHSAREIAETIKDFFPDSNIDVLENAIQSYIDIDAWNKTPILKQESFDKLQMVIETAGELKEKAPYDKIVNNSFAENAVKNVK